MHLSHISIFALTTTVLAGPLLDLNANIALSKRHPAACGSPIVINNCYDNGCGGDQSNGGVACTKVSEL